jgi:predicted nucleic acid-binding protein
MNESLKVFVDTNVLVYIYDVDAGAKQRRADRVISGLWHRKQGVISTQVLQELYVTLRRKLPPALNPRIAQEATEYYSQWVARLTEPSDIHAAVELESRISISFWDALIVVMALKSGAQLLLTEDLQHGQTIDGLLIENPFVTT